MRCRIVGLWTLHVSESARASALTHQHSNGHFLEEYIVHSHWLRFIPPTAFQFSHHFNDVLSKHSCILRCCWLGTSIYELGRTLWGQDPCRLQNEKGRNQNTCQECGWQNSTGNKNLFEKHSKYCIHKLVWMPIMQLKIIYCSSLKLSHNWLFSSLWPIRRALWKSI